ncbi:MAG: hypothetical protein R6X23_03590 [Acidimicrobiia bacterium]
MAPTGEPPRTSDSPSTPTDDLALLRRFEPIVRLTDGERFMPSSVDEYVAACSLRARTDSGVMTLVAPGRLTLDRLAAAEGGRSGTFLQFVSEDERRAGAKVQWRTRHAGLTRLARVGFVGRVADVLFQVSLIMRRTVPSGVAAIAAAKAARLGMHERPRYYARVVRDGGWTVLHYLFFYAMNDWRSTFGGVNDHEADWEQVMVFCEETDAGVTPRWVAFARHDDAGDDLRRAWDDPEITVIGEHAVVFVGGGSHASYFQAGDYVTRLDVPILRHVRRFTSWLRRMARIDAPPGGFGIPFVDSANGDGAVIGPEGDHPWAASVLDPTAPWVADFRGLWGLDTTGVVGGERAPGGPRFNRDGSVRQAWSDPVGFAGLQKVAPPALEGEIRRRRLEMLEHEARELTSTFEEARLRLRAEALVGSIGPSEVANAEAELARLRHAQAELRSEQRRLERGATTPTDVRAHLRRPAVPEPSEPVVRRRLLNVWGTLSAPLILGLVAAIFYAPAFIGVWYAAVVVALLGIEAFLRRRLINFLWSVLLLVVVGFVVAFVLALAVRDWRWVFTVAFGSAAAVVLVANLRELLARP